MGEWVEIRIDDSCEILDSQRVPLNAEQREKIRGNIPYYGANGVQGYINDYIFDEDLILMAEDGGYFEQFATRPIAYKISGKSWVNNHAHILRAKSKYNQDFIYYSLVNKNILYFIQGGTRSKLNQSDLKSISFVIPKSNKEQSTIATVLSTVDKAIDQTEKLIAKYERIKTGLMQDLLTKGIDEDGNIRCEETHEFKDSPLGRIPVEWEVENLNDICEVLVSNVDKKSYKDQKKIRLCNYMDIYSNNYIIEGNEYMKATASNVQIERFRLREEDVIITKDSESPDDIAIPAVSTKDFEDLICGYHLAILRPKPYKVIGSFLMNSLLLEKVNHHFKAGANGSTRYGLTLKVINNAPIAIPINMEEQQKIEGILFEQEKLISKIGFELRKFKSLKTALMQDLLTGKVSVEPLMKKEAATV